MRGSKYIELEDLLVYKKSVELADLGWDIYKDLNWKQKKIIGDQFITSTDSIPANLAEGYDRYHFLDRIKFYYNARGSLLEAKHWSATMKKREIGNKLKLKEYTDLISTMPKLLNNFISATYKSKGGSRVIFLVS